MGYRLRFKREALRQLDDLYRYIAEVSPEKAIGVLERVHALFTLLKIFPFLGRETNEPTVRSFFIGTSGIIIFYVFDEETISIIRVVHERNRKK